MSAQTVSNAVANRDPMPVQLVSRHRDKFDAVLPEHIETRTFVGLAVGALHRSTELMKAAEHSPGSFLNALLDCARLGHEPGTEAYYLVPFGGEVVGIEGYRGEIERIYRAGAVSSVIAEAVYTKDSFTMRPGRAETIDHEIDWDADDRGDLRLVYAYARMRDGAYSKPVVLNRANIDKIKREAKGASSASSPWKKWEEAMWLKSAIHQLEKWVPTSSEYRREQLRAAVEADNLRRNGEVAPVVPVRERPAEAPAHNPQTGEVVEAELVDDGPAAPAESPLLDTSGQLAKHMFALFGEVGITDKTERLAYVSDVVGREVSTSRDMTDADAERVIASLNQMRDRQRIGAEAPPEEDERQTRFQTSTEDES